MNEDIIGTGAHQLIRHDIKSLLFEGNINQTENFNNFTTEINADPSVQHSAELPLLRRHNSAKMSLFYIGNTFTCAWNSSIESQCPRISINYQAWQSIAEQLPMTSRFSDGNSRLNENYDFLLKELKNSSSAADNVFYSLWISDNKLSTDAGFDNSFAEQVRDIGFTITRLYDRKISNPQAYQNALSAFDKGMLRGFKTKNEIPKDFHIQLLKFQYGNYLSPSQLNLISYSNNELLLTWQPNHYSQDNQATNNRDWADSYHIQSYKQGEWIDIKQIFRHSEPNKRLYESPIEIISKPGTISNQQGLYRVAARKKEGTNIIERTSLAIANANIRYEMSPHGQTIIITGIDGTELKIEEEIDGIWQLVATLSNATDEWRSQPNTNNPVRIRGSNKLIKIDIPEQNTDSYTNNTQDKALVFEPEMADGNQPVLFTWNSENLDDGQVALQKQDKDHQWTDLETSVPTKDEMLKTNLLSDKDKVRLQFQPTQGEPVNSPIFTIQLPNVETTDNPDGSSALGIIALLLLAAAAGFWLYRRQNSGSESIELELISSTGENQTKTFNIPENSRLYFDYDSDMEEHAQVWPLSVKDYYITRRSDQFKQNDNGVETDIIPGDQLNLLSKTGNNLKLNVKAPSEKINVSDTPEQQPERELL